MQVQRFVAAVVILTLLALCASAQETEVVAPEGALPIVIPQRAPDRVIELPDFVRVEGLKVAESSGDVVALVSYRRLHVWPVLVHYWPEFLVAALSILAIVTVYRAAREGRQLVGVPYCRRCGYHLQGLPSDARCPECGGLINSKTTGVRGRFRMRRVACVIALVATPVSLFWFRGSLPRQLDAKDWFDLPSETANRLVANHLNDTSFGARSLSHASIEFAFLRLDPVAGRLDSTRHAPGTDRIHAWAISGDGARLAAIRQNSDYGFVWDFEARREQCRLEFATDTATNDVAIAFSADSSYLWRIDSSPVIQRIDAKSGRLIARRELLRGTTTSLFWAAELLGSQDLILSQPMGQHVLIDLTTGEKHGPRVDEGRILLTADGQDLVWNARRLDGAPVLHTRRDRLSGEPLFHVRDYPELPATTPGEYWIDAISLNPPVALIASNPPAARRGNPSMYLVEFGRDQPVDFLSHTGGGERLGVMAPDASWALLWGNRLGPPVRGVVEIFDISTSN